MDMLFATLLPGTTIRFSASSSPWLFMAIAIAAVVEHPACRLVLNRRRLRLHLADADRLHGAGVAAHRYRLDHKRRRYRCGSGAGRSDEHDPSSGAGRLVGLAVALFARSYRLAETPLPMPAAAHRRRAGSNRAGRRGAARRATCRCRSAAFSSSSPPLSQRASCRIGEFEARPMTSQPRAAVGIVRAAQSSGLKR